MEKVKELDTTNFDEAVLSENKTVLVDFFAEWCGPCKALAPTLDEIQNEMSESLQVVKVDVDKSPEIAQRYGVRGMPTMIIFKNGEVQSTLVGNQPKQEILRNVSQVL